MSHENGQFDISDIQLREPKAQPRVSLSREIGEAQIIHTLFGKAKVRIIRKHDKTRRAWWLTGMIGLTVASAAVWQVWFAARYTEPLQSATPLPPVNAEVQLVAPDSENIPPSPVLSSTGSEPGMSAPPVESGTPPVPQKIERQQGIEMNAEKAVAKPVKVQPPIADKPQTMPLATDDAASKKQTVTQPPAKRSPPKQSITVTTPPGAPASSPEAVVPLDKEDAPVQSSVSGKPLPEPVNVQSK